MSRGDDPGPRPASKDLPPAGLTVSFPSESNDQWVHIRTLRSSLEGCLSDSQLLLSELAAKLKEQEDRLAVATASSWKVLNIEDKEERMVAAASVGRGVLNFEESPTSAEDKGSGGTQQKSQLLDEDALPQQSEATRLYAGRRGLAHSRLPRVRKRDIVALEVLQGWRTKLPDDFGGVIRNSTQFQVPVVHLRVIDIVSICLVIANIIFMLFEVDIEMSSAMEGIPTPEWVWFVNLGFAVSFGIELLVRVGLERQQFAVGDNWRWNLFDSIVVLSQIVDVAFSTVGVGFVRVLRSFRMLRAVRIIKTARYVRDLRLMIAALGCSFPSLSWALLLIALVVVLYAMFIQQVVSQHILDVGGLSNVNPNLMEWYGSLPKSMLTLFMSATGGYDWKDLVDPLKEISVWYLLSFVGFLAFLVLGMMNILTAVFVESTNKLSDLDADLVIMEQLDQEASALNKMKKILGELDVEGTGMLTEQAFEEQLKDKKFKASMQLLDLHVHEARGLFHLLDADGAGEVDIHEMIHTLMRLKGTARSLDMATVLYENKRVVSSLSALAEITEQHFRDLKVSLRSRNVADVHAHHSAERSERRTISKQSSSSQAEGVALQRICAEIDQLYK